MAGVVRLGDLSKGHDGYPPTALTIANGNSVYCNGKLVGVVGSSFATHTKIKSPPHYEGVERVISEGSPTVFIGSDAVARSGDPVVDGDECDECSSDTFCN